MGPPALAAELTDHIIDFLHDDKETLSACALTHPTWLAASRFHLFNTITIDGDGRTKDQIEALGRTSGEQVFSCVRTVRIVSMRMDQRVSRLEDAASLYWIIQRGRSAGSYGSTPDLPTIHLCIGRYCDLGEDGILQSLSQISDKVTHLEFSSPILSRRDDLWPFVSSFPNLRTLEVIDLAFHHYGNNRLPPQPGLKNIPLTKIRMNTMSMGFVIDSLLEYADELTSLKEFGVLYEDVRQTALMMVAEAIQGSVKVLRFSAKCHPGIEYERNRYPSAFDISAWTFSIQLSWGFLINKQGYPNSFASSNRWIPWCWTIWN